MIEDTTPCSVEITEDDDTIKGLLSSDNTKHQFPDGTTYKLSCNSGKLEANIND